MEREFTPTNERNRIDWIDMARGFAILGIFTVNIGSFSAPYFMYGGAEQAWSEPFERFVQAIIDIFFQASFYTLFSILFGFSWQLMKDRLTVKGIAIYPFLFRRLVILIGIGMVHAFLIWHGDILLSYGVIGLLLLLFIKVRNRTLLIWAGVLLGGSVMLMTLALYSIRDLLGGAHQEGIRQAIDNYTSNQILTIWSQNLQDWSYANFGITFIFLIFTLLPLFLIGMYLARKGWLHEPRKYQKTLRIVFWVSLLFFVSLKFGPYLIGNPLWLTYLQDNFGGTASACFYLVSITLIAQHPGGRKLIQPFQYVGRMALSNYILQSVLCFILFYGVGFGLYGSITPSVAMMIVIVFYILQVIFSKWWLTKFRFGPLEWVWRSLNYGEKQPFRR